MTTETFHSELVASAFRVIDRAIGDEGSVALQLMLDPAELAGYRTEPASMPLLLLPRLGAVVRQFAPLESTLSAAIDAYWRPALLGRATAAHARLVAHATDTVGTAAFTAWLDAEFEPGSRFAHLEPELLALPELRRAHDCIRAGLIERYRNVRSWIRAEVERLARDARN